MQALHVDTQHTIGEVIPRLSGDIAFHSFDDKDFLVCHETYKHNVKINSMTNTLLSCVDGKRNIQDIALAMQEQTKVDLPLSAIHKILYEGSLAKCGIIESSATISPRKGDAYLKFRMVVFKEEIVGRISHLLTFLFHPRWFYGSLVLLISLLTTLFVMFEDTETVYQAITPQNMGYFYIAFLISILMHELGHATACRAFGAKPGAIGFGFYLFTPVFYADVSDAWKVKASKRVIVDLAGVYMEVLLCSLLGIMFLATSTIFFLHVALIIMLRTYTNLNPLLRFDGYWALSDLIKVPNLRSNSRRYLNNTAYWFRKGGEKPLKAGLDYFLVLYAFISLGFVIFFLISIVLYDPYAILYFPYNLFVFCKTLSANFSNVSFDWLKLELATFIVPAIFYYIVGRMIYKKVRNRKRVSLELDY